MTEKTTNTEQPLKAVPFTIHGEIQYHIDWTVERDPRNPDMPLIGFDMRYVVNPEVMFVMAEIMRHQITEVVEKDKDKKKKDRLTPLQMEMHKKTILLMDALVEKMGDIVYKRKLEEREKLSKIASGEASDIEIVSDPKVIDHIKKHG